MRRWTAVLAIGLMIVMFSIDMNIVALALPEMGQTFRQTDEAMSAVILSYSIPLTLLMIPFGLVVTRWPVVATFVVGIAGFALASVLCAFSSSFGMLLIGRALQGTFGSLMGTQGVAVVAVAVKPNERGRAMGLIGTMGPLGAVMGPGIGGLLLSTWGWPVVFLINVPVSIIAIVLALYSLPGITFGAPSGNGLSQMGYLLRHGRFLAADLTLLVFASSAGALAFLLPFALVDVQHLNPALAGVTLLVPSLGMALMGPLGGYLADRFGVRALMPIGWGISLLGLLALLLAIATPTSVLNLDWRLLLFGLGNGIAYGPLLTFIMSVGPRETLGAASALSNVTRQLGFICGPLLISSLWSWQAAASASERMSGGVLVLIALILVGLICTLLAIWRIPQPSIEAATKESATVGH
jgi:DHA2 family multidrug resistance protein-like MFS transporter